MFFGLHTTRGRERDMFLEMPGEKVMLPPSSFHKHEIHKPIVWEEDTGKFYEHTTDEFFEALNQIDSHSFNPASSSYVQRWGYKGDEPLIRMSGLAGLYTDIKDNGIHRPVRCTASGNRLDGSFRTKIAMHLGIKEVPAIIHTIDWRSVTRDFIERTLKAREMSSGVDYYSFDYGNGLWNIKADRRFRENASDRWEVLSKYIEGDTLLDLGCNEGYMSLKAAIGGMKVRGFDTDWNHVANLNKLVYQFVLGRDLDVKFTERDVKDVSETADTVLILNLIYHIHKDEQLMVLSPHKGKNVIFQCNLDKEKERDTYYGSHPDDLIELIGRAGMKVKQVIDWRNKPIIIAT